MALPTKWLKCGEHGEPVQFEANNNSVRAVVIAKKFGIDVDSIEVSGVVRDTDNEGRIRLADKEGLSASKAIVVTGTSTRAGVREYPTGDVITASCKLVDPILVAGKRAGTGVAFKHNGNSYVLTAGHVIVANGVVATDIQAFGMPLKCKGYKLEPDIAFLEPADNAKHLDKGFEAVDNGEVYIGATAMLLSYPEGLDTPPPAGCQAPTGTITGYDEIMRYAFASYAGAMPNSSGGAVVASSGRLLGIHCGLCWYEEPKGSPSSSVDDTTKELALMKLDTSYAVDNIPHKGSLPHFLLMPKILDVLKEVNHEPAPKRQRGRVRSS